MSFLPRRESLKLLTLALEKCTQNLIFCCENNIIDGLYIDHLVCSPYGVHSENLKELNCMIVDLKRSSAAFVLETNIVETKILNPGNKPLIILSRKKNLQSNTSTLATRSNRKV